VAVLLALDAFDRGVDFADALHLARSSRASGFATRLTTGEARKRVRRWCHRWRYWAEMTSAAPVRQVASPSV
jgi:hypothetical protein